MKVMKQITLFVPVLLLLGCSGQTPPGNIPTPESHFGFEIGTDKMLGHPDDINAYLRLLSEASGRIIVEEVGRTTDDNPYLMAYISSEDNIRNLEKYKAMNAKLADPRTTTDEEAMQIIRDGKVIIGINESIHASEVGPAQAGIITAYRLVSENTPYIRNILDNTILILSPNHNPDGYRMVVDWYRKYVGTEYEGSGLPYLYQRYVGHDNNRDWYMFTQKETRITIEKLFDEWHPQVVVDQHQKGGGTRLFVPPFEDPWEPNIDPIIQTNSNMIGTFMQNRLIVKGFTGVDANTSYDSWTPGRAFHHYHGSVRVLTETASTADWAAPRETEPFGSRTQFYPVPWEGGTWNLGKIVNYTHEAAMAALEHVAVNREIWLSNFYQIGKNAIADKTNPYAVVIPAEQEDPYTTKWLIDILRFGSVEVYKATENFTADGKNYEAGSAIIHMNQPYYSFAKTLLERQSYPELRQYPGGPLDRPYDLVAHTLPLLMGVEVDWINEEFEAEEELMTETEIPAPTIVEGSAPNGFIMSHNSNGMYIAVNRLLDQNVDIFWTNESFVDGNTEYPAGTVLILDDGSKTDMIKATAHELNLDLKARQSSGRLNGFKLDPVKVGLYKSWSGNMNEGWTRWVLQKYEFKMESAHNDVFRAGDLNSRYDAIIFANDSEESIIEGRRGNTPPEYRDGIGDEGIANLKDFVRNGGTLITYGRSNDFAIKHFSLGIRNVGLTVSSDDEYIPGSILKMSNNTNNPIAYGLPENGSVFYRRRGANSSYFSVSQGKVVASYPNTPDLLLSGWLEGGRFLQGKASVVESSYGRGRIVIIGSDPIYRAQAQTSFKYIFNALFYGSAEFGSIPTAGYN